MAENSTRKTQARIAERERRRRQEERGQTLKTVVPVIVGILILLGVGYSFLTLTNRPTAPINAGVVGPRLQVDRDLIDLGKQHLGNTVRAVFNLKNAGDGTLTLNVPRLVTLLQGC